MPNLETRDRASPEAISAANDLAYEALVESATLVESYARSLREAARRAEAVTVKAHILQLRACIVAVIGTFKELEDVEKIGGA
jgi:hypothetical protein